MRLTLDIQREWLLTLNQRLHWRKKADRTKWLRAYARLAARHPLVRTRFTTPVRCVITVRWPDGRRRDVHNLTPTFKACIDGIVDAETIPDDSDDWLIGPDPRVSKDRCPKHLACQLVVDVEPA